MLRQFSNLQFGQPGVEQRSRDEMIAGRDLPGPEVALIIHIDAVRDGREPMFRAKRFHHREQLVLAMETARAVVAYVFGAIKFGGGNDFERNAVFAGELNRIVEMSASQARRIRDYRQHVGAEHLVSSPGEKCGVYG